MKDNTKFQTIVLCYMWTNIAIWHSHSTYVAWMEFGMNNIFIIMGEYSHFGSAWEWNTITTWECLTHKFYGIAKVVGHIYVEPNHRIRWEDLWFQFRPPHKSWNGDKHTIMNLNTLNVVINHDFIWKLVWNKEYSFF